MLMTTVTTAKTLAAFIYKEITYTDKQKPKLKTTEKKKQKGTDSIPHPTPGKKKKKKARESTNTRKTFTQQQQCCVIFHHRR